MIQRSDPVRRIVGDRRHQLGRVGYAGPRYHHYVFEFYALNTKLDLPATASRPELLEAMKGKVIAKSAYVGRFKTEPAASAAPAK